MDAARALLIGPNAWLIAAVVAPFIGSFLGVLVDRLPCGVPFACGRSRCDHCGHTLSPVDLLPLLSFALLRGRCRHCAAPIGLRLPAIEIAATAIALWSATVATGADLWLYCLFGWWLLTLAWIDVRTMLLPDSLTLPLLLAGLAATAWRDPANLSAHVLGAAFGYALLFAVAYLYQALRGREGLGLGDAKLLAALGAWLGLAALPAILLLAALLGLVFAAGLRLAGRRMEASTAIPFGPCLAAAAWLMCLYGDPIDLLRVGLYG